MFVIDTAGRTLPDRCMLERAHLSYNLDAGKYHCYNNITGTLKINFTDLFYYFFGLAGRAAKLYELKNSTFEDKVTI